MAARSLATTVGFVGGLLVLLGGLWSFLSALVGLFPFSSGGSVAGPILALIITAFLGLIILFTSRPRFFWWPGRRLFNAFILVILGVVTWLLVGGFVLTLVGAVLTILAGILLPIEGIVLGAFGWRRRWFHRRIL